MRHYTQLSLKEREAAFMLYHQGISVGEISRRLGRARSTMYRELSRLPKEQYDPLKAHKCALDKRHQLRRGKIQRHSTLRQYVRERLIQGWSPEQICGRLKQKKSKYSLCHETIYQFIYRNKKLGLYKHLRYKQPKRGRKNVRKYQICRFGEGRIITNKQKYKDKRTVYGHWEGDLIKFKGNKNTTITTLVEQQTKLVLLIKNANKRSETVMKGVINKMSQAKKKICRTITFDQGSEFARYRLLEKHLRCGVFYCHKSSPWEKGINENTNGRLRRYLPKKFNINQLSQEQLDGIMRMMNNTPRKCLGYRTPKELFLIKFQGSCCTWL